MTTEFDIDQCVIVAQAPSHLGKRIIYASQDQPDGVWRGENTTQGRWGKPEDYRGAGSNANAQFKKFVYRLFTNVDTLDKLFALRDSIRDHASLSLILGQPTEELLQSVERSVQDGDTGLEQHITSKLARSHRYLRDAPSRFFTIDLDGLDLAAKGYDAREHDYETPDIIMDVFDECGLGWLISDCVIHFSSSHGLIDRTGIRAHMTWQLATPLTISEQKAVAEYINVRAAKAGIATNLVDTAVYEPRRFLFTAPAETFRRVLKDGRVVVEPVPPPDLWRVRQISNGQRYIEPPDEALDVVRARQAAKRLTGVTKARITALDTEIKPGNVYAPIRARIYKAAVETPAHLAERVKEQLKAELRAAVEALPDNDEKGYKRVRLLSDYEFERSWEGALAKRNDWRIVNVFSSGVDAPVTIEAARNEITAYIKSAIEENVEYAATCASGTFWVPPAPVHRLILSPPGIGKTEAVVRGVRNAHLYKERISHLSPNLRLSEETRQRMLEKVGDTEEMRARVRHHKGRQHLCSEPTMDKAARMLESMGESPLQLVCSKCPRLDVCPWPVQRADAEKGFIAGQHAHMMTTFRAIKPDNEQAPTTGICDESILSQALPEPKRRRIHLLERWAKRARIVTRDGKTHTVASIDLCSYRAQLITAIKNAEKRVSMKALVGFSRRIGRTGRTQVEDAIDMEHECTNWWRREFQEAVKDYQEHGNKNKARSRMRIAAANIEYSRWFFDAFRLLRGSMSVPGRKHLFGLRRAGAMVYINKRKTLPRVMLERGWLYLDGTADPDVWKAMLRNGEHSRVRTVVKKIDVVPGHYHLTQYPDKPYGKRFFSRSSASGKRDDARISKMSRFIAHEAKQHKDVLVICQQHLEQALLELGELPDNVHIEHYRNIRGIDKYKSVACAIIIGRSSPNNDTLELMTEALHYDNEDVTEIRPVGSRYYSEQITLPMNNRRGVVFNAESHPDEHVRAMRRQVVDAEVRQAIMRLRLFDRTAENPATLHVFGQIDTGLVVNEVRDWRDAERSRADEFMADGVISTSQVFVEYVAQQVNKSAVTIRRAMTERAKLVNWPEYRFRMNGKLCRAYVNAADVEQAARSLSLVGIEATEICAKPDNEA